MRVERNGKERIGILKKMMENIGNKRRIIDKEKINMKIIVKYGKEKKISLGYNILIDGLKLIKDLRSNYREIKI